MKFVDFNDTSIPIGQRKVAYVKWAVSKGTDLIRAKKQANRKFGKMTRCLSCGEVFDLEKNPARCPNCGE